MKSAVMPVFLISLKIFEWLYLYKKKKKVEKYETNTTVLEALNSIIIHKNFNI
jgi:hypothetical protein